APVVAPRAAATPLRGSLLVDAAGNQITFIKTGGRVPATGPTLSIPLNGVLAADTYTVTFLSGANNFKDASGAFLDGNNDGTNGNNYSITFTIAASGTADRTHVIIPT